MTEIFINEQTEQGKALLGLIKTFPKKIVTVIDEEDLSDCITLEEFGEKLRAEVKKRLEVKKAG